MSVCEAGFISDVCRRISYGSTSEARVLDAMERLPNMSLLYGLYPGNREGEEGPYRGMEVLGTAEELDGAGDVGGGL